METFGPFVRTLLVDKIKLSAHQLNNNLSEYILRGLRHKFEGKCSYHGYIMPGSIQIHTYSMGRIVDMSLNGDVEFLVQYYADLCNPAVGSVMKAKITKTSNKTNYAHFAEVFVDGRSNKKRTSFSVIEIVLLKKISVDFEEVKVGDEVLVEIMGKKFQLNDRSISAWGKIVKQSSLKTLLDDANARQETDIQAHEEDDIQEVEESDDASDKIPQESSEDDESQQGEEDKDKDKEEEDKQEEGGEEDEDGDGDADDQDVEDEGNDDVSDG